MNNDSIIHSKVLLNEWWFSCNSLINTDNICFETFGSEMWGIIIIQKMKHRSQK
ncbi:hypothetical protein CI266_001818 [Salmonella enterica subsp. enterica serovar Kotte]|nr:hypothetical protein [Salmonella enterica subsp. enterica serovar Kotte]